VRFGRDQMTCLLKLHCFFKDGAGTRDGFEFA
jgi:hypothetical protein